MHKYKKVRVRNTPFWLNTSDGNTWEGVMGGNSENYIRVNEYFINEYPEVFETVTRYKDGAFYRAKLKSRSKVEPISYCATTNKFFVLGRSESYDSSQFDTIGEEFVFDAICPKCQGTGELPEILVKLKCDNCNGKGS